MSEFINIIAWGGGVVLTLLCLLQIWGDIAYQGSVQQIKEEMRGIERTFYWGRSGFFAFICWAWVWSKPLG